MNKETPERIEDRKTIRLGPLLMEMPAEWRNERLKDVTQLVTRGKQPTYSENDGVPVINQECIYWNGWHFENTKILEKETAEEWSKKNFAQKGDVLINSTGQGTLGRALVYRDDERRAIDSHVTRLNATNDLCPSFFRYFLESNFGNGLLYSMCVSGSTGQIELSKSKLKLLSLPVPPLPEQRKIASILYNVDQAIQKTEEIIEQTKRVKKGVMQDLFQRGLNQIESLRQPFTEAPEKFTEEGRYIIPSEWKIDSLQELCSHKITYGIVQPGPHIDDGVPYIQTRDMTNEELPIENLDRTSKDIASDYSRSRVEAGEIVISIRATVGRTHQIPNELHGANLSRGNARISPERNRIQDRFLLWSLRSNRIQGTLNALTKGTTYDEITLNQLRKVLIPYPPDLEEQRAIVEILDNIQSKINKEQNQYNKLQEMKKGLMQDLLTGKVRTHDKDIEVLDEVLQHE